jgi:hypothetical protein
MGILSSSINQILATGTSHIEDTRNKFIPVTYYKEVINQLDSKSNFIRGYNRSVSSGELTREEFDTACRISNDEHLQNMGLQNIYISDLHLFDAYLTAKDALYDRVFPKEWRYVPRCERELCESNPPKVYTTPNGREVSEGFYNLVYEIFWEEMEGRLWPNGAITGRELLGENFWQELDEKEKQDATSCLMDYALEDIAMIKLADSSTSDLILFKRNAEFFGEKDEDYEDD